MKKDYPSVKSAACVNGFVLKCIAIATMLTDHIGAVLFPYQMGFRYIGRIAFPIFCFMLVEGFIYTHSLRKYELRLLVFAFISEIPFDLAFHNTLMDNGYQNVFFTLFLGLLMLDAIKCAAKRWGNSIISELVILIVFMAVASLLNTDYSAGGVLLIYCFYRCRNIHWAKYSAMAVIFLIFYTRIELWGLLAIVPLILYNGKRGFNPGEGLYGGNRTGAAAVLIKYLFYIFYPVHLLILYIIALPVR